MSTKCIETRPILACYTPISTGEPETVVAHIVYENGIPIAQAFTRIHDSETPIVVDLDAGDTITPGACPSCVCEDIGSRALVTDWADVAVFPELTRIADREGANFDYDQDLSSTELPVLPMPHYINENATWTTADFTSFWNDVGPGTPCAYQGFRYTIKDIYVNDELILTEEVTLDIPIGGFTVDENGYLNQYHDFINQQIAGRVAQVVAASFTEYTLEVADSVNQFSFHTQRGLICGTSPEAVTGPGYYVFDHIANYKPGGLASGFDVYSVLVDTGAASNLAGL